MPVIVVIDWDDLNVIDWKSFTFKNSNFSHLYHHIVHYILEVRLFILSGLIDTTKPASITILTTLRLTILLWSV